MAKVTILFGSEKLGEHNLDQDELSVGRAQDCDIVIDNMGVSRHHCSLVRKGEDWVVVDKGSNNGTYVGDERVSQKALTDQDRIVLGKHSMLFDAFGYAEQAAADKKGKSAGLGAEMTMFVDPAQIQKMQQDMQKRGGAAALILKQGGREVRIPLTQPETTIGKKLECDIPVKGLFVKPVHAQVIVSDGNHRLIALGSLRPVRVNGSSVTSVLLKNGDTISIAGSQMVYQR
jgi:pSer/pThr/pTyr-binding forkhead associated (FHA) protein